MLSQAAGLAVLAAISPTELLVAAVYLGSRRPRITLLCYLAGALLMTTIIGVLILVALRSGHLDFSRERSSSWLAKQRIAACLPTAMRGGSGTRRA